METPFVFGRIATDRNFTDREVETRILVDNFKSLINTIIISPRRWGKSSLVNKAAKIALAEDSKLRICHVDLFNIRNEKHFYATLAQKIISATSSKWEEAVENAKRFLSSLIPRISVGTEPGNEISLDLDWREAQINTDEILDLPEKIAKEKGIKIVVCIDEFQNIAEFGESDYIQKKLRSHWQNQQRVAYCLYGSKRHMMMEVFTNSSKPFYKFGNLIFLNKIESKYLVSFFRSRFEETGKTITEEAAEEIARLVDNHPYYAQQLAQLAWLRTDEICDMETVETAHESLVEQLSLLFVNLTENLTVQQLNFLHAVINGEEKISSAAVMRKYSIVSSASVTRSKAALMEKDIIDGTGLKLIPLDPIYSYWLKHTYFSK